MKTAYIRRSNAGIIMFFLFFFSVVSLTCTYIFYPTQFTKFVLALDDKIELTVKQIIEFLIDVYGPLFNNSLVTLSKIIFPKLI